MAWAWMTSVRSASGAAPSPHHGAALPGRRRVVYVAGKFRGASAWEVEQNVRRAETVALDVWRLGAAAVCPHTNTRYFDGAAPDAAFLEGDLEILRRCDAVILVDGWEHSAGASAEAREALRCGLPIFTTLDRLARWLRGERPILSGDDVTPGPGPS